MSYCAFSSRSYWAKGEIDCVLGRVDGELRTLFGKESLSPVVLSAPEEPLIFTREDLSNPRFYVGDKSRVLATMLDRVSLYRGHR
jgi:hypothetical protein